MAIEFNCPYCTASIRVPDAAAGKRGTCPKCATKLIVPLVGPPPGAGPPVPKGSTSAGKPHNTAGPPPIPAGAPAGFPAIPSHAPVAAEAPAMAQVVRKRAKRKGTNPLIPITLFSLVMGLVGYWMLRPGVTIEGELAAEQVPGFEVPPASIDKGTFPLQGEEDGPAWEELIGHLPSAARIADQFQMRMEPEGDELNIIVEPVASTEVFRVKTNSSLRQFINLHADDIAAQKAKEFEAAAKDFITDWQSSKAGDLPFQIDSYFDTVGLNRLTGVMGYTVVAQVGEQTYRCVHEDAEGRLYFCLPTDTDEFILKGRRLPDGKLLFESRLTVKVSEAASEPMPAKTSESETPSDPMTEPMMLESEPGATPESSAGKTP